MPKVCPYQDDYCGKSDIEYQGANRYRTTCKGTIDGYGCKGKLEVDQHAIGAHPKVLGDIPYKPIFKSPIELTCHLGQHHSYKVGRPVLGHQFSMAELEKIHDHFHEEQKKAEACTICGKSRKECR